MVCLRRLGDRPLARRGDPRARGRRDRHLARRTRRRCARTSPGRDLFKSVESGWAPWAEGEWLALPIHQVLVRPSGAGPIEEPWEPIPGEIEFFLNDVEDGVWLCRRDERVTRPGRRDHDPNGLRGADRRPRDPAALQGEAPPGQGRARLPPGGSARSPRRSEPGCGKHSRSCIPATPGSTPSNQGAPGLLPAASVTRKDARVCDRSEPFL